MIPSDSGAERRDTERVDREPWPFTWSPPVETPATRYQREVAGLHVDSVRLLRARENRRESVEALQDEALAHWRADQ